VVYLPDMDCFLCCVILCSVLFCDTVLLCVTVCLLCIALCIVLVSACDVRATTLTEVFPCVFLSCKVNAEV
jgi:hypothetical protein